MKFLLLLEELKKSYENDTQLTENGVALLGSEVTPPPLARHYVFPPMPATVLQQLIAAYKRTFPKELIELYRAANGMNLFWTKGCFSNGLKFPFSRLDIFGVQIGPLRTCLQPYSIIVEDSSRVPRTPDSHLKFACYRKIENLCCEAEYNLFVDTDDNSVYASNRSSKEFCAEEHWSSIDDCLCSLFERISST